MVASVVEGSEAERAGLRAGDTIVDVDGAKVDTIEAARARLGGPLALDVTVAVRRGDQALTFRVPREAVRR
jgi:S1-C subfamily serine protease